MTATQLKQKIDSVVAAHPDSVYSTAKNIVYIFTDGVLKTVSAADIRIDMNTGKMWLLEGVSV